MADAVIVNWERHVAVRDGPAASVCPARLNAIVQTRYI